MADSSQTYQQEITAEQLLANGVSEKSISVIDHFGPNAAEQLNDYSCKLEDALITTDKQLVESVGLLKEVSKEHKAYEKILTNPDLLADYTCEFFGANGPYPVPSSQAPAAPTGQYQRPAAPAPVINNAPQVTAPQRPEMPAPPQPQRVASPTDFWKSFGGAADRNPQEAWKYLNQAQQNPEIFRQKLLVME